jgi:eukaryotic-like serine/threonine-protein kinase
MHRTSRLAMATLGLAGLTACANTTTPRTETPQTSVYASAPSTEASSSPSPSRAVSPSPSPSGPKLVDADLSGLKNSSIDLGVPVVIILTLDSGGKHHLTSHPDGSADFTGTAVTESTRMTIKPAKVRQRADANKNHVVIVASPKVAAPGPATCLTDVRETVLRMDVCRPGGANQSWRLTPFGDSGAFELTGAHTAIRSENGPVIKDGGWSAFQTIAVAP